MPQVERQGLGVRELRARGLYARLGEAARSGNEGVVMPKCPHRKPPRLPYGAAHADARQRLKRREHQRKCHVCGKWIWGEYWHEKKDGE